jgi:nucleotide-binding universal stress UspA family protein
MVTFTKILYPTDMSEASRPALDYAVAVARSYGARLTVLHAVPPFEPLVVPTALTEASNPVVYPPSMDDVCNEMRRFAQEGTLAGIDVHFVAHAGDPSRVVVEQAVSDSADLIVIGTHGRSGFDRLLSGSVAEKVLRRAPCPVLTIPPHARAVGAGAGVFARILCAVDFSSSSQQALGFALALASQASGAVTVATALEWLAEEEPRVNTHFNVSEYRQHLLEDARARLGELVRSAQPPTAVHTDDVVTLGRAHREVLRLATEQACDLIVMGAQGRGGVGLALFGSTTQQVVRGASCPVLVVHRPGALG